MDILIVAALALGGMLLGSTLWVTSRLLAVGAIPARRPPCHGCGVALGVLTWAPLFGALRRCPSCGVAAGGRLRVALELALAAAFAVAAWRMDGGSTTAYVLFCIPLIVIGLTDAWSGYVFRNLAIGGILLGIVVALIEGIGAIDSAILGAGAGLAIFAAMMVLARGILPTMRLAPIGGGDVLVAGMIGAMAGWPGALFALAAGVLAGGVGAVVVLVRRRARTARVVPFGPFLCGAALVVFLLWF